MLPGVTYQNQFQNADPSQFQVRVGAAGQYGCPLVPHHSAAYGGDNYQHSPQPTYQHSPQPAYQQAPQPAYQQAPQPTYQQAPQPTYHQAPQPTYQHSPQATYQPSYQPAATSQPASHYATQPRRRQQPGYRPSVPTPRKEMFDVRAETEKERNAILGQPFRSRQLIAPTVKPTWDYPCGSYLDAQRRGPTEVVNREPEQEMHPNPKPLFPQQPAKTAWVQAQPPPSQPSPKFTLPSTGKPFVLQTDDKNKQIVHAQFNSPLNIYSTENVVDTIQGQTGYRPEMDAGSGGAFVPSATMRAVYEDEAYTTGGALQVQEAEPYQSKSVKQLQSMYS